MKTTQKTIQAIFAACGKQYPTNTDTLKAIDFISELIDENHSLYEPEEFTFEDAPQEDHYSDIDDYRNQLECWEESKQEALQEYQEENESNYSELFDAVEYLESRLTDIGGESDFYFEYDGNEYRVISENSIWDIYVESIKSLVEDCYSDVLKLDDIPSFIALEIDWEQTAKNAYVDGYGHHFSGYDGSELEIGDYHIFRTN